MLTFPLIGLTLGAGLGFRFKVLVLIPAQILACGFVALASVFGAVSAGQSVALLSSFCIAIQVGYLASAAVPVLMLRRVRAIRPTSNR